MDPWTNEDGGERLHDFVVDGYFLRYISPRCQVVDYCGFTQVAYLDTGMCADAKYLPVINIYLIVVDSSRGILVRVCFLKFRSADWMPPRMPTRSKADTLRSKAEGIPKK
eukprot:SAG31_NODE_2281_length_6022_cov_3.327706_8_plen_110_part_00